MMQRYTDNAIDDDVAYINEVVILGKVIGVCFGWDLTSDNGTEEVYYDFVPFPNLNLPRGDLFVNYGKGTFDYYNDLGQVVHSYPICETV